jgi:hypothetical protein
MGAASCSTSAWSRPQGTKDQAILRRVDIGGRNGIRPVWHQLLYAVPGKGVHEEGLALSPPERSGDSLGPEQLSGLCAVLSIELAHLGFGEVSQRERGGLDVEGRAWVDRHPALRLGEVVPEVAHADQRDGRRERAGPGGEPGSELT